jgi:hypothetical protein
VLDEELPEPCGVPGWLAELPTAGRDGGHGAADAAHRVWAPAVGLPVAGQGVPGSAAGCRAAAGCFPGPLAGGQAGELAGAALTGGADRLLAPAPGACPGGMTPAERRQGLQMPPDSQVRSPQSRQAPVIAAAGTAGGRTTCGLGLRACLRSARAARRATRAASWQDRHSPLAPIGCWRPHQGQVPSGCFQRNSRQALQRPLSSPVRSPQSRHAPVTRRDLASQLRQRPDHSRATCLPQSRQGPAFAAARFLQRSHRSPNQNGRSSPQAGQVTSRVSDSR